MFGNIIAMAHTPVKLLVLVNSSSNTFEEFDTVNTGRNAFFYREYKPSFFNEITRLLLSIGSFYREKKSKYVHNVIKTTEKSQNHGSVENQFRNNCIIFEYRTVLSFDFFFFV